MAALVFCLPLKILLNELNRRMKINRHVLPIGVLGNKISNKQIVMYLTLCIILGILVAFIPHLSKINPNNERLGVDTPRYVTSLMLMENQQGNLTHFVFSTMGDRPLTMIILFLITEASSSDPFHVVEFSPMLFAPLLVIVTFFLTRELTSNDRISVLASFISAISFQTLTGIYSGFYANWIALILGYLAFVLLVKCLKSPSKSNLVALAVVMTGVLLAHAYTWTIIIFVAFIFLFVLHILRYYPKKHFLLIYLILSSSIAVDLIESSWTGSSTGLGVDVSVGLSHGFGISQFSERLVTLSDTIQTYYGGVYANIAILGLGLYWLVRCQTRELTSIFLMIFMTTALIPLFLGDYVLQSRVLYNIPFQILATISLYVVVERNGKMIFIAILLIMFFLSFHVLTNLGYIPSEPGYSLKN